jgi:hypothetical protein
MRYEKVIVEPIKTSSISVKIFVKIILLLPPFLRKVAIYCFLNFVVGRKILLHIMSD